MNNNLFNFKQIEDKYLSLIDELDSPILPISVNNLANEYFLFVKTTFDSFNLNDFNLLSKFWLKKSDTFELTPMNIDSIGLIINNIEHSTKKNYVNFINLCQQSISKTLFDNFTYNLVQHKLNKDLIPPFILFSNWLENPKNDFKKYSNNFSQEHFNNLSYFNNLPILEEFIDKLLFISQRTYNHFDNYKYLNINLEYLKELNDKFIYFDVVLKNNSIGLQNNLIDYIKNSLHKFDNNSKNQFLENDSLKSFFIIYEKQKFEFLFPNKNIKNNNLKI